MRRLQIPVLALALLGAGCGSDSSSTSTDSSLKIATGPAVDATDACSFLSESDFAAAGFTSEGPGYDVSENFTIATETSIACQWTTMDDNVGSSWELVIGTGDAESAVEFALSFAEPESITMLQLGDDSYLLEEVSAFDANDIGYEVGVRLGDTYFTISTPDDRAKEAIVTLATLVSARLAG